MEKKQQHFVAQILLLCAEKNNKILSPKSSYSMENKTKESRQVREMILINSL